MALYTAVPHRCGTSPREEQAEARPLSAHMLPIVTAFGSISPSGVIDGLTVRHAVGTPAMQFSPSLGEASGNFDVLMRTPGRFSNYYGLC